MKYRFSVPPTGWLLVVLAVLAACGGGVGSGGTGIDASPRPVGQAQGTVSGFGSVIVDGERYDDRQAEVVREVEPGVDVLASAQLGQGVAVTHDSAGVAKQIRVDVAVSARVTSVSSSTLVVLGQTVTLNTDVARGPVTQFGGGYTAASSVLVGDVVEVHGVLVRGAPATLQATRIERLDSLPAYLKVTGQVSMLSDNRFRLGGLQVDAGGVLPAGTSLVDGQVVAVLARPSNFFEGTGMPRLVASQVRVKRLGSEGSNVSLSGAISGLNAATGNFNLSGFKVHYAGATLPAGRALADGLYVRVNGQALADGGLQASAVTLRDGTGEPEAELKGTVLAYDAASKTFHVRDVLVDASTASLEGCAGGITNGVYVEIEGFTSATGVRARKVHCQSEPTGATVGRSGLASRVNPTDSSFLITPATGAAVTVHWTSSTVFQSVGASTLSGKRVEVEGVLVNGVLTARKIQAED